MPTVITGEIEVPYLQKKGRLLLLAVLNTREGASCAEGLILRQWTKGTINKAHNLPWMPIDFFKKCKEGKKMAQGFNRK